MLHKRGLTVTKTGIRLILVIRVYIMVLTSYIPESYHKDIYNFWDMKRNLASTF